MKGKMCIRLNEIELSPEEFKALSAQALSATGPSLLVLGDPSVGPSKKYIELGEVLKLVDSMVVEGQTQMSNRMTGRTGSEQMPIDDTQIGIEFAEDFLRKKVEALQK